MKRLSVGYEKAIASEASVEAAVKAIARAVARKMVVRIVIVGKGVGWKVCECAYDKRGEGDR